MGDADMDISRMTQMRREAEAMGEELETMVTNPEQHDLTSQRRRDVLNGMKGREFVLDPRIWNSMDAIDANVPAAGGRFSARGLAHFYHDLASGKIFDAKVMDEIVSDKNAVSTTGGSA